ILLITCTANAADHKKPSPTSGNPPAAASSAPQPSTTVTINGTQQVFPALDQTPDTNDPEFQTYLKGLDLSQVPNLPRSNGGVINHNQPSCNGSTQIDQNQGSWTCQKYTASDDIQQCPTVGNWGVTYDDGPSVATPLILDELDQCKLKATFFVVGSRVVSNPQILLDTCKRGHHIAVHTWSHPALTSLSNEQVVAELYWTIKAIKEVCGITPIYYRPPFGDTDNRVRAITRAMAVLWVPNFDSNDWQLTSVPPAPIDVVINTFHNWTQIFPTMSTGFIVLQHDLYNQTVKAAIEVLKLAINVKDLKMTTIPECIGDTKPYVELG
ncbi:17585_t:CDS:2, partial [Racocetra persica]